MYPNKRGNQDRALLVALDLGDDVLSARRVARPRIAGRRGDIDRFRGRP